MESESDQASRSKYQVKVDSRLEKHVKDHHRIQSSKSRM